MDEVLSAIAEELGCPAAQLALFVNFSMCIGIFILAYAWGTSTSKTLKQLDF